MSKKVNDAGAAEAETEAGTVAGVEAVPEAETVPGVQAEAGS